MNVIFYILAGLALLGVLLTWLVPMARKQREPVQPQDAAASQLRKPIPGVSRSSTGVPQ